MHGASSYLVHIKYMICVINPKHRIRTVPVDYMNPDTGARTEKDKDES